VESVYSAVRTYSLYKADYVLSFKGQVPLYKQVCVNGKVAPRIYKPSWMRQLYNPASLPPFEVPTGTH